jgi:dihydroorotate dehydrogenase
MTFYEQLLFPILRRFDPEAIHHLTLRALASAQSNGAGRAMLRRIAGSIPSRPVTVFGLRFANELGVAAGFDKNAEVVDGLAWLGFGHVEVGTLTPRPQPGNARPRIFRLAADKALINRMGFPNQGAVAALQRIKECGKGPLVAVLGVSLGKQKETALEEAAQDYLAVMEAVHPYADYLAVNVSSPNTPGLRLLQRRDHLEELLGALVVGNEALAEKEQSCVRPLLLKVSPDLTWPELDQVLEAATAHGFSGIVACNTTLSRESLRGKQHDQAGGLSGRPLRERSTEIIRYVWRQCSGQLPIIGVGGVMTAEDVRKKLDAGASLVQLYTGLVYKGPGIAGQILRRL